MCSRQVKKSGHQSGTWYRISVAKLELGRKVHSPTTIFHSPMASRRPDFSSTAVRAPVARSLLARIGTLIIIIIIGRIRV